VVRLEEWERIMRMVMGSLGKFGFRKGNGR
jgi:hypothetical protein